MCRTLHKALHQCYLSSPSQQPGEVDLSTPILHQRLRLRELKAAQRAAEQGCLPPSPIPAELRCFYK